jgi:hypothetical protein
VEVTLYEICYDDGKPGLPVTFAFEPFTCPDPIRIDGRECPARTMQEAVQAPEGSRLERKGDQFEELTLVWPHNGQEMRSNAQEVYAMALEGVRGFRLAAA